MSDKFMTPLHVEGDFMKNPVNLNYVKSCN